MFCNCKMCQLSDFVNFVGHKYFCRANGQWKYLFRRNFIQAVIQKKLVTTLKYRVVKVSPGGSLPGRGSLRPPWEALACLGQHCTALGSFRQAQAALLSMFPCSMLSLPLGPLEPQEALEAFGSLGASVRFKGLARV